MDIAKILPLTIVMIAGPQILSAIFLATSEDWRSNSAAFVLGASLSITAVVTVAYLTLSGISGIEGSSDRTAEIIFMVVLVLAAIHTFRNRRTAEPPKWMGMLQTAHPRFSFKLGFLLLGVFPTDIATSVAVGAFLADRGDPWWHMLPFLALTLLLLSLPALLVLALGQRANTLLPRVRDWMNDNSWVVSEIVLVFFIALTAKSLL